MQRSAAGTDENELGLNDPMLAARFLSDLQTPQIPITSHVLNSIEKMNSKAIFPMERIKKILCECTIVHVRTGHHPGGRDHVVRITPFHDQWEPLLNLFLVLRIFHPVIKRMARKRRKALLEKGAILLPPYEAEVGYGMNKGLRVSDRSLFHQVGPELTGEIELGVDLQRL